MLVLLLLLIPVFCMSLSIYISMLYEYVINKLNVVPFCISLMLVVVLGFIIPRLFYKLYKSDTPGSLNAENKINNLSNYISYLALLLFGIANFIKFIINDNAYLEIYLSMGIVFLFIYITYSYYFAYKNYEFKVVDRVNKNKKTDILMIRNEEIGSFQIYVYPEDKYEVNKVYNFKYNSNSKVFKICKYKKNKK